MLAFLHLRCFSRISIHSTTCDTRDPLLNHHSFDLHLGLLIGLRKLVELQPGGRVFTSSHQITCFHHQNFQNPGHRSAQESPWYITLIFNILSIPCYFWGSQIREFFSKQFFPRRHQTTNRPVDRWGTLNARTWEDVIHDQLLPRSPAFLWELPRPSGLITRVLKKAVR